MEIYRVCRRGLRRMISLLLFLSLFIVPHAVYADSKAGLCADQRGDAEIAAYADSSAQLFADQRGDAENSAGASEYAVEAQGTSAASQGAWYDEYVGYVLRQGYMSALHSDSSGSGDFSDGFSSDDFGPDEPMTRAMFVSALYRMADTEDYVPEISEESRFGDVDGSESFVPALLWAYDNKIIRGMNGNFCPDLAIDREMIAVMIQRASAVLGIQSSSDWSVAIDYIDLGEISDWAIDGIAYCTISGIMSGNPDGSFAPKRSLTRAEAAAIITRIDKDMRVCKTNDRTAQENS